MRHEETNADVARFNRWATRVRRAGHLLRRVRYEPETLDLDDRRLVIVANHRSLSDVFIAIEALHHYDLPARCLVRAKYFESKLGGAWLRAVDCIPAGDGKRESIDTALETIDGGRPVAVMIEGKIIPPDKRAADGMGEIRPGFVEIARKAGVDIMPIGVFGSDEIWGSRSMLPRIPWRGRPEVRLRTGRLISVEGKSDDEVVAETRAMLAGYLAP
ncbi:MAG: lysophospholipid acyltransferase family protein [Acidimicrobiales bacterium]|nr:lysophospholipid acyltransferase family protein [Acidimicrobiales bacterium]